MKKLHTYFKISYFFVLALLLTGCVHDDVYDTPANADQYECQDLTANVTIADLKNYPQNAVIATDGVIECYVSSSDQSGNIYKYIYIQDKAENPTQGLTISVDAVSTYTKFPQGSKVYIKLKGLAVGKYANLIQLGAMVADASGTLTGTGTTKPTGVSGIGKNMQPYRVVLKMMKLP